MVILLSVVSCGCIPIVPKMISSFSMMFLIRSKLANEVDIVSSFFIPTSFERLITLVKSLNKCS